MVKTKKSLVIIGAGMAGLSAGLTWALNNDVRQKPVCLLDKEPITGGSVTTYIRKGYAFDTCQMISNLSAVFEYFGLKVEFKEFHGNFGRVFLVNPDTGHVRRIDCPSGEDRFKRHICELYPSEARAFTRFFNYSQAMFREIYALKYAPTLWEMMKILFTCPKIVKHAGRTFADYLSGFQIQHPDILEITRLFTIMAGYPEHKVAALLPLGVMFSLLEKAFRPKHYFIDLPKQMEKRFVELGGEVRLKCEVEKILVEHGRVTGVRLRSGEIVEADCVISTVDVKLGMQKLLGLDVLQAVDKKYAEKVKHVSMTASTMNINLGLDDGLDLEAMGFDCGYNMLTTGGKTLERLFAASEQGTSAYSERCFHLGVICPSITTGGKPTLTISVFPMPLGQWHIWREQEPTRYRQEKEKWGDYIIGLVERYLIPDLRKHIVVKDISTPATYARYSGSPTGSIYDMASSPDNFGLKRLRTNTPVKGLFQPKFAHGVFGTINGGMQAVDMIMGRKILNGNSRFQ